MRNRHTGCLMFLGLCLSGIARGGEFVRNQDLHFIEGFGAMVVVDGRLMIGKEGSCNCIPLATQLRVDNGPYISFDPEGETPIVRMDREINLKAEWTYVVTTVGRPPTLADHKGARPDQKHTRTTEVRVRVNNGKHAGWFLGVDHAAMKAQAEALARAPDVSEAHPLPKWPLLLVRDPADALVFARRETWRFRTAK